MTRCSFKLSEKVFFSAAVSPRALIKSFPSWNPGNVVSIYPCCFRLFLLFTVSPCNHGWSCISGKDVPSLIFAWILPLHHTDEGGHFFVGIICTEVVAATHGHHRLLNFYCPQVIRKRANNDHRGGNRCGGGFPDRCPRTDDNPNRYRKSCRAHL